MALYDESVIQWAYRAGMAEAAHELAEYKDGLIRVGAEGTPIMEYVKVIIKTDRTIEDIQNRINILRGD